MEIRAKRAVVKEGCGHKGIVARKPENASRSVLGARSCLARFAGQVLPAQGGNNETGDERTAIAMRWQCVRYAMALRLDCVGNASASVSFL